jgi:hypothetical protein
MNGSGTSQHGVAYSTSRVYASDAKIDSTMSVAADIASVSPRARGMKKDMVCSSRVGSSRARMRESAEEEVDPAEEHAEKWRRAGLV